MSAQGWAREEWNELLRPAQQRVEPRRATAATSVTSRHNGSNLRAGAGCSATIATRAGRYLSAALECRRCTVQSRPQMSEPAPGRSKNAARHPQLITYASGANTISARRQLGAPQVSPAAGEVRRSRAVRCAALCQMCRIVSPRKQANFGGWYAGIGHGLRSRNGGESAARSEAG